MQPFPLWKQEAERLAMQLVELLTELGRDAFEHGVEHGIVAQINGRIDNYSKIVEQKKKAEHFQVGSRSGSRSFQRQWEGGMGWEVGFMHVARKFGICALKMHVII